MSGELRFGRPDPTTVHIWGNGADLGPTIQAAVTGLSGSGKVVLHGTVNINTQVALPTTCNSAIELAPGCNVVANIGPTSGAVFLCDSVTGRANPSGGAVTTTANTVVGAYSVTISAANGIVAGNSIALVNITTSAQVETHTVVSVVGTTLTVVEPFERVIASGSSVFILSGIPSVRIVGAPGATISGSAEYAIQLMGVRESYVADLLVSGSWAQWAMWLDWGCRNSVVERVRFAQLSNGSLFGLGFEQTVNCWARNVVVDNSTCQFGVSFELNSCVNSGLEGCRAPRSWIGVHITVSAVGGPQYDAYGGRNIVLRDCSFPDSANGIRIDDGGADVHLIDVSGPRCTTSGILIYAPDTGVYPSGVSIVGGDWTYCGGDALQIQGGSGHRVHGFDASNSVIGLQLGGGTDIQVHGLKALSCTGGGAVIAGGANVGLFGCTFDSSGVGAAVTGSATGVRFVGLSAQSIGTNALQLSTSGTVDVECADLRNCATSVSNQKTIAITGSGRYAFKNMAYGFTAAPTVTNWGIRSDSGSAEIILDTVICYQPLLPSYGSAAIYSFTGSSPTWRIRNFEVRSGGASGSGLSSNNYGMAANAACTVFRGADVDMSSAGNPWSLVAGCSCNFGTFVANGATPVVVNNATQGVVPAFQPDAVVAFAVKTAGGTPHGPFMSAPLSAGAFSVNSLAGDTSTYYWQAT